jgi:hypothetical protein
MPVRVSHHVAMANVAEHDPLVEHISRTCAVSGTEAIRIVEDVVSWFAEPPEDFVRRRHRELQQDGVANAVAFGLLADELEGRPVPAPRLSTRQIRRMIYS